MAEDGQVVAVASLAMPEAERAALVDLLHRYGRSRRTGAVTIPEDCLTATVRFHQPHPDSRAAMRGNHRCGPSCGPAARQLMPKFLAKAASDEVPSRQGGPPGQRIKATNADYTPARGCVGVRR